MQLYSALSMAERTTKELFTHCSQVLIEHLPMKDDMFLQLLAGKGLLTDDVKTH